MKKEIIAIIDSYQLAVNDAFRRMKADVEELIKKETATGGIVSVSQILK